MSVRMKDIAERLGVSVVTVSKALKNHPDIAEKTRERVLALTKELNYRPNLMARSLVTGRSSLIGFIVPDLIHPFFSEVAKSLSGALRKKEYFLLVASSQGDPDFERAEIEHMLAHRLDALVVATCQPTSEHLRRVGENGPPLILLDRHFPDLRAHFIGSNDYKIGELATEHLIASKRTRIAHVGGSENWNGRGRFEGYRDALKRHGLPLDSKYVVTPEGSVDADALTRGEAAMNQFLDLKRRPDAIFCFNDTVATGLMNRALQAKIDIPRDLAVVGCGNYHYADMLRVPLTSIDQETGQLGERAAKMIFTLIEADKAVRFRRIVLEPRLVLRRSSMSEA